MKKLTDKKGNLPHSSQPAAAGAVAGSPAAVSPQSGPPGVEGKELQRPQRCIHHNKVAGEADRRLSHTGSNW